MALEGTPLYVSEGYHNANVLRVEPYVATSGIEGVIGSTHFRTQEMDTPDAGVDVLPGAAPILARGPGQQSQSYIGLSRTETNVPITPTDSSGSRSDLIILNVEDPNDGTGQWPAPPSGDEETWQYIYLRVEENVPAGTTSVHDLSGSIGVRNAITLARIDLPSSTGTVTNSEITDLRELASPLEREKEFITPTPAGSTLPAGSPYIQWPDEASWSVFVPSFATQLLAVAWFTPHMLGNAWGSMRFVVNGVAGSSLAFDDNYSDPGGGGGMRIPIRVASTHELTSSEQGQTVTIKLEGTQESSTGSGLTVGDLLADRGTNIYARFLFRQELA